MKIKPLNRHLVIEKVKGQEEEETTSSFVVPEEFRPKELHSVAKVLEVSEDSKLSSKISSGDEIIIETSMVFQVKKSQMILENYVYGLVEKSG
tara:strand:- start:1683 stop:1961 length:279 start_codon:yes stop_codon:yes gene_type:complete